MFRPIITLMTSASLVMAISSTTSVAQTEVTRIIVPIGPGNPFDSSARVFAEALSKVSGKSVVVENKAGAGGRIPSLWIRVMDRLSQ